MNTDTKMVTVVALVRAKPGRADELRALLRPMVTPSRLDAGCLNYDLHESADEPGSFLFHENWRSEADLERHLAAPHVTSVLAQAPALLAEAPKVTTWYKLD